jgi:hypothetical protein
MSIRLAPVFLSLLLAFPCGAQVPPGEGVPFPLSLVLEAVQTGAGCWRPDWPLEIPPDAFAGSGAARIELELGEASSGILEHYRLERTGGRLTDFPLALPIALSGVRSNPPPEDSSGEPGPVFVQVHCRYDEEGSLAGLDIEIPGTQAPAGNPTDPPAGTGSGGPSAGSLVIHFDPPYVPQSERASGARVLYGDRLYLVLLSGGIHEITETWFDSQGIFSAYFTSRIGPEIPGGAFPWFILGIEGSENSGENGELRPLDSAVFHRESGGNLSEYAGGPGLFSAVYGPEGRPHYWVRGERNYSLQWDEEDRLVRMRDLGTTGPEAAADEMGSTAGPSPVDFRYEYEYDTGADWVLRRETALFRTGNLLLPAYRRELIRTIVYEGDADGGLD